ncbi:MAG: RagB/SusD family nutrient uptake outer membrane protein [Paraprevotella sp.]|nr:RagB/SusD family nutrient uptake outer membrane protein [Paraprevotella sp.]MBR0361170.1 RagB/SusD family nutrient uptake outer membrane protein [Paraprevotella sp.]
MKRYIYHIIGICLTLTILAGCDDFLDIQPTGKVIPKTGREYRALLTEAYSAIPSDRGKTVFRTDELILDNQNTTTEGLNSFLNIWLWLDDESADGTSSFGWRSFYYVSYIANTIIENGETMTEATSTERSQLIGEAYMLRAYMHFVLVNLYGEPYTHCDPVTSKAIPLKLNSDVNATLKRNTVEEIYTSILSDINKAKELLNVDTWDEGFTYRFNRLSIDAFLAKVYLYMGDWDNAYQYASNVITQHGDLEDLTTSSVLPSHYKSVEAILSMENIMPAIYQTEGRINTELLNLYRSGDMRKSKYYRQVTASISTLQKGGNNEYRCTFRSSEFYLIAAEAALELEDLDKARLHLTTLMKARYHKNIFPKEETKVNNMNQDELRQEIQDERFRELAFEGHRWFDLRRTTQPVLTKKYQNSTYTLEQNDSRYTLRIPSEAIEANPGLAE